MFPLKDKLYLMAKDHSSDEAAQLIDLVEAEADIPEIIEAKDAFLDVLMMNNEITSEDYDDLSELDDTSEIEDVYAYADDDDFPEPNDE